LVLSAFGLLGAELLAVSRWLNIFLFGATIFATGAFSYRLLRSNWLAISLSACVFTIPTLVDINSGAMSEPLCLFTGTAGIFLILLFLETDRRRYLILAVSAAGLAFLTRYIGVFAIATGLIVLLVLSRNAWKERLTNLVLYGLVSIVPNTAWWLYVYLSTSTYAARQVVARADLGSSLIELRLLLMEVFWSWLPFTKGFTYSYNSSLKVLLILGLLSILPLGLVLRKWWQDRQVAMQYRQESTFLLTWCIFSMVYAAFLACAFIFTMPRPDIDLRMLLPIQFGMIIALLSGSLLFLRVLRLPSWCSLGPITLVLVTILANLPSSMNLVRNYYIHGGGYTSIA
jgi:4-amino-4-deoxy-L-arabinose transferase-like glycosyltransferase